MKIAITGTRGIPNHYGGFEQFAEELSVRLVRKGHEVLVYNPEDNPYKKKTFEKVNIVVKKALFKSIPQLSTLLYDYVCLRDAVKNKPDAILNCGYSSSLFYRILRNPQKIPIITHMDGMEWQRQKWGRLAKAFLKWTEKLAMKWSAAQVVDHFEVQKYFENKYGITPVCIPYGADIANEGKPDLKLFPEDLKYQISTGEYYLVISRLEPENNLDLIFQAYIKSGSNHPLIIVGNTNTKYGKTLVKEYEHLDNIKFLGPIFNKQVLDKLRVNCKAYIHGHSVGGTNPSLSEAMAASCPIFAHDNIFNRGVLEDSAFYFSTASLLSEYLWDLRALKSKVQEKAEKNLQKVRTTYNWNIVVDEYIALFEQVQKGTKKE